MDGSIAPRSKYERNSELPILPLGKAQHEIMEEEEQRIREASRLNQAKAQRQKADEQEVIRLEKEQNLQ
ncbi:conserved hypothetical protein [Histoplasma capsulatum H143]|uniref:Uncharacterized protein n=1 Tax=Ajellomyces capsulatus (strain H143) TaxID=544712 RepID=C6HP68_AJECH|nr:conserved hypothetical protein [Histoplasma capsulatum H143]